MLKILQRYVLKEVLVPAGMTLGILTFLLLAHIVFMESDDLGVSLSLTSSIKLLGYLLPSLLIMTVPLALLIGILLGIGRLTVDSEIKACRTHGVQMFGLFSPVLIFGLLMSGGLLYNSLFLAPNMMNRLFQTVANHAIEAIDSLQPQKFNDQLRGGTAPFVLYFEEREKDTGDMKGVHLWLDGGAETVTNIGSGADDSKTSETLVKNLIVAARGRIEHNMEENRALLSLSSGTIHMMPEADSPIYTVTEFSGLDLKIDPGSLKSKLASSENVKELVIALNMQDIRREISARQEALLIPALDPVTKHNTKRRDEMQTEVYFLRAELFSRISISLSCFAFVLIGVPLAIYIRPSGKALGVSVAFGLYVVYFVFLHYGQNLAESGRVLGHLAMFLPLMILVLVGVVLMYRVTQR